MVSRRMKDGRGVDNNDQIERVDRKKIGGKGGKAGKEGERKKRNNSTQAQTTNKKRVIVMVIDLAMKCRGCPSLSRTPSGLRLFCD